MFKLRPSVFETNSSSGDYYNEPDYEENSEVTYEITSKVFFDTDEAGKQLLEFVQKNRIEDLTEAISYAGDFFSIRPNRVYIKNDDVLCFDYDVTVTITTAYKRGFKPISHVSDVGGLSEDYPDEIEEFKKYLIEQIFEILDIEDTRDEFEAICSLPLTEDSLKIINVETEEVSMSDIEDYFD